MAQIRLRVDDEVKQNAEKVLDAIGLSMSAAINIFLKTVARENRIPFKFPADPFDMPPESCASFKVSNQLVY